MSSGKVGMGKKGTRACGETWVLLGKAKGMEVEGTGVVQKEGSLGCTTTASVPCLSQVGCETRDKSQEKLDDCKATEKYPHGICRDQCRKFLLDLENRF